MLYQLSYLGKYCTNIPVFPHSLNSPLKGGIAAID